jgi:proteasome alpha subunit
VAMQFYASPEQIMRDRSEFARKNIARGRGVVVLSYEGGVLFVAENPSSTTLHKVSEIYDRIGFAAAGKYNEFENLRQAGVRLADSRGYLYDRRDVTALGLANAYAQLLGNIFSESGAKPYEAELVIAEVGDRPEQDQIYRIPYDGSVVDSHGFVVIGGAAEAVSAVLTETYQETPGLGEALRIAVAALGRDGTETRELSPAQLEVAVLDRNRKQPRKFRRLLGAQLAALLQDAPGADAAALVENGESAHASAAEQDRPGTDAAAPAADTPADGDGDSLDTNALIDEALDEDSGRGEDNGDN